MKNLRLAALAFVAIGGLSSIGGALAAQATAAVNVRSGPGTGFAVVDVLYPGEEVDVEGCTAAGWCSIIHYGPDGWVSARYLTGSGSQTPDRPFTNPPDVSFSITTPNFSFSIGNPPQQPNFPNNRGGVCFYEHVNYEGRRFCVPRDASDPHLGGFWNDRVSSIRIFGSARLRACEDWNYRGDCIVLRGSRSSLPDFNDIISSYWVQ